MSWQPIETAPKDGTPVVLFCIETHIAATCVYRKSFDGLPWSSNLPSLRGNGNRIFGEGFFSHWMPLPPPPTTGETA